MASWKIRRASGQDLPELLALHRELYVQYRDEILDPKVVRLIAYRNFDQILAEDIRYLLDQRDACIMVAESESALVGYISGRVVMEDRRLLRKKGTIEDWFVQKSTRGAGIGKKLLQQMQDFFREQACEVVEATTWSANQRARELYALDHWSEIQVLLRKEITS